MILTSKGSSFTLDPENDVKYDPCNTAFGGKGKDIYNSIMIMLCKYILSLLVILQKTGAYK
jgi:hypothetical protein